MSIVMLIGAILLGAIRGGIGIAMTGFQRLRSSPPGHSFLSMTSLVRTIPLSLSISPMLPRFPRRMQHCEKMISMGISDIYGSIPEGFS